MNSIELLNSGEIIREPWSEEDKDRIVKTVRKMAFEETTSNIFGIKYFHEFYNKNESDDLMASLVNELKWERRDNTPRMEYYFNTINVPYVYGSGRGVREYSPKPVNESLKKIKNDVELLFNTTFEVCFLNRYENQKDHLGWHADDSPEMDDDRPIVIVSFGVEREIWFKKQNGEGEVEKYTLGHGSLCVMPKKFQETYYHRIPKAGRLCGRRISLTFRGYKNGSN